jgi:hypothetical protein
MAKCPRCDAPIIQGDQYCGSCGITLQSAAPPGSAPPGSRFASASAPPPPVGPPGQPGTSPWGTPSPAPVATLPPVPGPFTPAHPPRPRRSSGTWIAAAAVGVVVAALAAGAYAFTRDSSPYPKEWDAQVAPIAARVAQLRGLTFEHPVEIEYASPADFEKEVTASPDDLAEQKEEIEQATAVFRAAGLLGGDVDLGEAVNDTASADVIALYDPKAKKIVVRGDGAFTVETRVTLAHELTHVLQDQHFDLRELDQAATESKSGSSDALTGLIEGDAQRIEKKYLAEQSEADRTEYEKLSNATSDEANERGKDVPPVIETYFGAPYIYGPQVVSILEHTGGNQAIDDAITGPTPTTRIYLDPTAVNQVADTPPPVPALQTGEHAFSSETVEAGDFDVFDDFTLYLMLGARLDPITALRAADAFAAGSSTPYTTDAGTTCLRASVEGVNPESETFLAEVLGRWAKEMPDAKVESTAGPITFRSCDPGERAVAPTLAAIRGVATLAAIRDQLTETFITSSKLPADIATCVSRVLMQMPGAETILRGQTREAYEQGVQLGARAGTACRQNPLAGIP